MDYKKRTLLILGTTTMLTLPFIGYAGARLACRQKTPVNVNASFLHRLIGRSITVAHIGKVYISSSSSLREIYRTLEFEKTTLLAALSQSCESTGRRMIKEEISTDFFRGNIEVVDGWVISRSEAIIYGLYYASIKSPVLPVFSDSV